MALPAGYRLIAHHCLDSTNAEALRRIAEGSGHGTVIRADGQTDGRGRRGRRWESPVGNLYASVIVVSGLPARPVGQLAFIAGLAGAEALAGLARVRLKWPNDLLLNGRKLGGILIEAEAGLAVIGVGINLGSAPVDTEFPATSLIAEGVAAPDPGRVLDVFCAALDRWYGIWLEAGFTPVREAWLALAAGLGEAVEARLPGRTVAGQFSGLDADGALMLETQDGGVETIAAGDVFFAAGSA